MDRINLWTTSPDRPPWVGLRSSSPIVFLEWHDENRHRRKVDDRLGRTFAGNAPERVGWRDEIWEEACICVVTTRARSSRTTRQPARCVPHYRILASYLAHVISSTPGAADFFRPKKLARRTATSM